MEPNTIEQMQSNIPPQSDIQPPKSKKTWLLIVVLAVAVLAAAFACWQYFFQSEPSLAPAIPTGGLPVVPEQAVEQTAPLSGGDTIEDITADLNATDLGDIDSELNELDSDINQL